ncbi:MFS transporter [Flammeovirga kamogawensis]|uniref:MFS transporter n=1 Tax=Flammeovirga kamogawensis TaxID=373891 RepID=A0ABX8H4C4_9BACT|nr:MFS transporter [Flammeovirga kamogawensis]MBB6461883.1 ACS family hexuronate transporter-like MFS transporter [Flammeovirga kamogawensis]QWG10504.1 MFS transporter [Flammeovirga kamogawensis]TRX63613.1 MFS transporter [Flammeovirga kamogawensis]
MDTTIEKAPLVNEDVKSEQLTEKKSNYRYRILSLLFMATTINYMDRSIMGVLAPTLETLFDWTKTDYANINIAFKLAYAIGMLSMGGIIDKFGTRIGYVTSIAIWSAFGMMHALLRPAFGLFAFMAARFGLGFGEAGNFPAAVKTVAEWFPKKDRAFATGIFNAGSNVGAILAPIAVGLIVQEDGTNWQYSFLVTGIFSAIWILLWLKFYKKPKECKGVNKAELDYIQQDDINEGITEEEEVIKLPWSKVAKMKETWAFAVGKMTDGVWFFFMFWSGMFFKDTFGVSIKELGAALVLVYVFADLGSIAGGYLSRYFIDKGWSLNKARKTSLLICALCIVPVVFATLTENQWIAAILIAIASGGHQAWSANLFTLASDIMPKQATASVVGIGGMVGAVTGMAIDFFLGKYLDSFGDGTYFWMFLIAGCSYLVILGIIQLISPNLTPAKIK